MRSCGSCRSRWPRSGVFVDQSLQEIASIVEEAGLGVVQLHGDEPVEMWEQIEWPVIKAVAVTGAFDAESLADWPVGVTPLLDAHDPARKGGTGRVIDWERAHAAARVRRIVLSGGLNPANVRSAIQKVRPWAVDAASGVEQHRGIKDRGLMQAFVEEVRAATSAGE